MFLRQDYSIMVNNLTKPDKWYIEPALYLSNEDEWLDSSSVFDLRAEVVERERQWWLREASFYGQQSDDNYREGGTLYPRYP